jgi:ATP-dependent protease Clp ATPase subunit
MYELPAMTGVREVVVDVNAVSEGAQPLFIYEDEQAVTATAVKS